MLKDKFLQFSEAQAVTGNASSADVNVLATDYLDFGTADSKGMHPVAHPGIINANLVAIVDTAFVGSGVKVAIELQGSDDDSTYAVLVSSAELPVASLAANKEFNIKLPCPLKRYMKVNYRITGGNCTAGKLTTYLTLEPDLVGAN